MSKDIKRIIWRAALGGVVGGFLGAAVLWPIYKFQYGQGTSFTLFVLFVIVYSPFVAGVGAAIGMMIWHIRETIGRDLNLFIRALLGASSAVVLGIFFSLALYTDSQREFLGLWYTMFYAKYGLFVGTLAGILAAPAKREE